MNIKFVVLPVLVFPLLTNTVAQELSEPAEEIAAEDALTRQQVYDLNIQRYNESLAKQKDKPNNSRVEYKQDPSTPNGIVYRHFLSGVIDSTELSREDAVHNIVDRFKLSHDEAGTEIANSLYDKFVFAADNLTADIREMVNQL